jgi:hypothetical protein
MILLGIRTAALLPHFLIFVRMTPASTKPMLICYGKIATVYTMYIQRSVAHRADAVEYRQASISVGKRAVPKRCAMSEPSNNHIAVVR